jgi:hypothetical protein
MRSPGRRTVARREERQRFWAAIARGPSSEDAAVEAGVSQPVGSRWFRDGGGMPTVTQAPLSERFLSFIEREDIAILNARGLSVRGISRQLGRSPTRHSRSTPVSTSTSATRAVRGNAGRTRAPTVCCVSTSRRGLTSCSNQRPRTTQDPGVAASSSRKPTFIATLRSSAC